MKHIQWKKLLLCLALPLAVGGAAGWLIRKYTIMFEVVRKPPLAPPGWVFPVVWTALYLLMGLASYLVLTAEEEREERRRGWTIYLIQLAVNFLWPILFFRMERYWAAFLWLCLLWVLVAWTLARFLRVRRTAGWLLVPYLAWTTFAGYLNFGVALLNG